MRKRRWEGRRENALNEAKDADACMAAPDVKAQLSNFEWLEKLSKPRLGCFTVPASTKWTAKKLSTALIPSNQGQGVIIPTSDLRLLLRLVPDSSSPPDLLLKKSTDFRLHYTHRKAHANSTDITPAPIPAILLIPAFLSPKPILSILMGNGGG